MNTTRLYSAKAEKYTKYRWDYAPQAIQTIFETSQLSGGAVVADFGTGDRTGTAGMNGWLLIYIEVNGATC